MADLMAQERACDRTSDNSKQRDLFPKARTRESGGLFMQTGAMERGGFKRAKQSKTDLFPKACGAGERRRSICRGPRPVRARRCSFCFAPCGHAGEALSALLPYGKGGACHRRGEPAAGGGAGAHRLKKIPPPPAPSSAETLRSCFRWQDDIRAAVGIGTRGIAGGALFCHLTRRLFPSHPPPIRRRKGCLRRSPRPRGRAIRSPLPT